MEESDDRFLLLYISDSDDEIITTAVKELNTLDVYKEYSLEF